MKTFLASENLADAGYISTDTAWPTLPATYLQQEWFAKKWRSKAVPCWAQANLAGAADINVVALGGFNGLATTQMRVRIGDDPDFASSAYDSGAMTGVCDPASGQFVHILEEAVSGQYVRIDMADEALSYAQAGRIFVSGGMFFEINDSYGRAKGYASLSRRSQSLGGQIYIDRKPNWRRWKLSFDNLNADESLILQEVDRVNGTEIDLLISIDALGEHVSRDTIIGLVRDPTDIVARNVLRDSKTYVIEGRL
ncbi:hypothetical protein FHS78_000608 [Parvibaculum indicum]|uniref:hypothetical protein n=1 Tax=Parvibaculum indicum TaxID=562969 RepID=UPI00141EB8BF|nr:hypothetical protein [Parvibaculum indicum]NIJ40338.1 hypothetical protein [Parvibaculum indicum]